MTQKYKVNKCCWKSGTNRLAGCRVAINLQSVQKTRSVKSNKVKLNKARYTYIIKLEMI